MKVSEIIEAIKVGFDKPKLYKRSVWNKSVKIMEYLVANTTEVIKKNLGPGLEKYQSAVELTEEKLHLWALAYKRTTGEPLLFEECVPELHVIARELGVKVNNVVVLKEYFNRHPEDAEK